MELLLLINTYILSRTVSKLSQIIVKNGTKTVTLRFQPPLGLSGLPIRGAGSKLQVEGHEFRREKFFSVPPPHFTAVPLQFEGALHRDIQT